MVRVKDLPKELRQKAIDYICIQRFVSPNITNEQLLDYDIKTSFTWCRTPEGHEFWEYQRNTILMKQITTR